MKIRKATEDDAMSIMTVANLAYIVEKGDSGAGFKKEGTRYDTIEEVKDVLEYMSVAELPGKIVGVIGIKGDENSSIIGPLAVHPSYQGRGISKRLLDFAEDKSCITVAGAISCKTDLIKMYERRGYTKKRAVDLHLVIPEKYLSRSGLSFIDYEKTNLKIVMNSPANTDMQSVMKIVNDAYKVELGNSGLSFKSADRFVTLEDALKIKDNLMVAKINNDIVGVIGIDVVHGVADLGPIAVCPSLKGRGIGSKMLRYAENLHPITMVGVVSCRSDVLPFYTKRGYKTVGEVDFDTAGIANVCDITRRGLKYVKKQKINYIEKDMIKLKPAETADIESIVNVVNSAYRIEMGDTGIAFKTTDRFETVQDALDMKNDLHVAKVGLEIVGIIGITPLKASSALGPLAVSPERQGYGVGEALLQYAESSHRVTEVDVVSCRTDLLPMYQKRGYKEFRVSMMEEEGKGEFKAITREGLTVIYMRRNNW